MSTVEKTSDVDLEAQVDNDTAARLYSEGNSFPPDLVSRIQERAARIREETFTRVGYIDVNKLIQESRDER